MNQVAVATEQHAATAPHNDETMTTQTTRAIVPCYIGVKKKMEDIMKNVEASRSKDKHFNKYTLLLSWIYNNEDLRDTLQEDNFIEQVHRELKETQLLNLTKNKVLLIRKKMKRNMRGAVN